MQQMIFIIGFLLSSITLFASTPGTLDTSFSSDGIVTTNVGGVDVAYASVVQPDGKIVVVGSSDSSMAMARYTVAGALDTTEFGTGGIVTQAIGTSAIAYGVAIQNNGKIVVVGSSTTSGVTKFFVAQFTSAGALDTAGFGSGVGYVIQQVSVSSTDVASSVVIDNSGNIYVIGTNTKTITAVSSGRIFVAKYSSTGALATGSYNSGAVVGGGGNGSTVAGIALLSVKISTTQHSISGNAGALASNGKIVVTGADVTTGDAIVARFTTAGLLDEASFNASGTAGYNIQSFGGTDIAYAVGFQSTGKIIIAGTTGTNAVVARFTAAGVLDSGAGTGFGPGGTPNGYNDAISFTGTTATIYGLAVQTDDTIVVGGTVTNANTNFVIACYASDGSALVSSFGSSTGYTITDISGSGSTDTGRSLSIQSNGRFVMAGTSGNDFAVTRSYGLADVEGCIDVTYNAAVTPGYVSYPTNATSSDLPQVVAVQYLDSNSVFVLTKNTSGTPATQLIQLDSAGSATSSNAIAAISISTVGGADVIADSHGRALVVGTDATSNGWIGRYIPTAGTPGSFAFDSSFNSGSVIVQSSSPTTTAYSRVCEQASGNILAMGQNGTTGIVVAYNQDGSINTYFGTSGVFSIATITLTDMIVDSADNIYLVGNPTSGNIKIYKILANGSGYDLNYASGTGIIDTSLSIINYPGGAKLSAINSAGELTIVAVDVSLSEIDFYSYYDTGLPFNSNVISSAVSNLTTPLIKQMQIDSNDQPVYIGYDQNFFFVGRLLSNFNLDTTFAPYSSTPGILKTKYDNYDPTDGTTPQRLAQCVTISPDGAIVFGGYENISSSQTVSVVGNIVGTEGGSPASQLVRYPGAQIGQLDTNFGTDGVLSLSSIATTGNPQAMYVLSNNKILTAIATGTDTVLGQLTSGYALDTASFGSGTGKITLTGLVNPKNIMVDVSGNIYVVGDNGVSMMLFKLTSAGVLLWSVTSAVTILDDYMAQGNVVLQMPSGAIIVAGYGYDFDDNANYGAIAAFNPDDGTANVDFGSEGFYFTNVDAPIVGAAITSQSNIIFTFNNAGDALVQKIYPDGSGQDVGFVFGTALSGVSANDQIKLQLDSAGNIVVVINNGTNFVARRYNLDGSSTGGSSAGPVTITLSDNSNPTTLNQALALSNQEILILGSHANGSEIKLARLNSSFALDSDFNYNAGILQTAVGSVYPFFAMDVTQDQNILVTGVSTLTPEVTAFYNDVVVTKVNQSSPVLGAAGTLDTTFNQFGANDGYLNMNTDLEVTQLSTPNIAKVVLKVSSGEQQDFYYVAADNGTNSYITYLSADDVQQTSFGTSGVLTISGNVDVADMMIAQNGTLIVVGGNGSSGSNAGWIKSYDAETGIATSGFNVTDTIDVCKAVAQQSDGRILVAGQEDGVATMVAYDSVTGALDGTFGTNGNGRYTPNIASTVFNSLLVDASDRIYSIANNGSGTPAGVVYQISLDGITLLASSTPIAATNAVSNHIAFDQNHNIIAVTVNSSNSIIIERYNSSSSLATLATLTLAIGTTLFTTPVVTSLLIDETSSTGNVIVTGYDSTTNTPFVMRVLQDLSGLDTSFNTTATPAGIQSVAVPSATVTRWYDAKINQEGKILVAGYGTVSTVVTPYLMQVYGNEFVGQYEPTVAAGTPGTIDTNFGTSGKVNFATISGSLAGLTAQVVLPILSNGYYYTACTDGSLVRLTNGAVLDTSFGSSGFAAATPAGIFSLIIDGSNRLFAAGTTSGAGWVKRYTAGTGTLDGTFNTAIAAGLTTLTATLATVAVEQTVGRYVVAGQLAGGNGALFGFTNDGAIDTTFNSQGTTPGVVDTGIASPVYAFITDAYDRLIIAYKNGSGIDLVRLASSGQFDIPFGTNGIVSGAIANADDATQVRVALDAVGNIVLAAHINDGADKIAVKAYANGTGTTVVETQLDIIGLTSPTLTSLITDADGYVYVAGYQSGSNTMLVARINDNGSGDYQLDTAFGGGDGIMTFSFNGAGTVTARNLNSIAIYGDGQIAMVGTETDTAVSPNISAFLSMAYNNPYTTQEAICQYAKPDGTNDRTLGASTTTATNLGVTFFASSSANTASGQIARAVALPNDAKILVAVDGNAAAGSGSSDIMLQMFTVDGTPDTTFATTGQSTILSSYANQNVNDMLTFTTASNVNKAIIAGYAYDATLGVNGSLLLQYDVTNQEMDSSFGGFDGNPQGIAFGDGQFLFSVAQQSTGRVVVAGQSLDTIGLLLGYTADGKIDTSFGNDGYYNPIDAADCTSITTHVVDTQNRIVIAYMDQYGQANVARCLPDGSGLDITFNTTGNVNTLQTTYAHNGMKLALDGSNNIFLAVVADDHSSVTIYSYNQVDGSVLYAALTPSLSLTDFSITKLLVDIDGKVILIGYDTFSNQIVIARTLANLSDLDSSFNADDTPGYLKYAVAASALKQISTDALIHPDGRILVAACTDNLSAAFSYDNTPDTGDVDFDSSTSTGQGPLTYFWDFGDGETSTEPNPNHTYMSDGDYNVRLTVTDAAGNNFAIETVTIAITPP